MRKFFTFLLALTASVGMMNAKVTWNSSNISDLKVRSYQSYSKEGVTLSANSDMVEARWQDFGDESMNGISFNAHETGGFTFSNTLGKNFTKIEMTLTGPGGWDFANLGSGWSFYWDYTENPATVTWTGNASTVDLLKEASDFGGEQVKSIVFYFEGDSEAPDPTYSVALKAGTVNADKVTLSATSAVEGATVTVTPNEEYEITAFSAYYVVVNGQLGSINEIDATLDPGTGAYSFTMPAYAVTIEATIALKPVPEGDIFAGFTATAGSGGFDNEGHANLVDNKYISSDWTKWCANDGHKSVPTGESESCWWIDFEASAALSLTGYILTTGNDTGSEHGRNPKNWVLKAKLNADDAWTTIATVTDDVTMKNKSFKDYKFFVDKSGSYQYFRFEVFANQGAGVMQLCELRLIGSEAPAPAPKYYVVGTMNSWQVNEAYEMTPNNSAETEEYMFTLDLTTTSEFKVKKMVGETETWYPGGSGNNYGENGEITADGNYTIYFRPNGDGGDDWFYNVIYVAKNPTPEPEGDGKLTGAFTINADGDQILFSKGNLQYQASTTTLRFATNQYDMIGEDNANISDTYTGWIDLFGWGTGDNPAKKSTDDEDYSTFTDWGTNAISNGGNEANLWRTLTRYEWAYLIQTRTNAADLKGQATVADVHGYVLLPDSWILPAGLSFTASPNNWTTNVYTAEQWAQMEAAGAVFLPATGYRNPDIIYVGEKGWYWSSDVLSANAAYDFEFTETTSRVFGSRHYFGQPVRLVTAAPATKYYIVGTMTDWQVKEDYEMKPNNSAETEEYMFTLDLTTTSEFKVKKMVGETETWYPGGSGNNYGEHGEITSDGNYTIYFRPNADGGEGWFYNVIYVEKNGATAIDQLENGKCENVKMIIDGQLFIIRDGKTYTVTGQQVR